MTDKTAPASELELIDAVVTSLDAALEHIDEQGEHLSAGDQLAVLAVGVARGLAPLLRSERDRMLAEAVRS